MLTFSADPYTAEQEMQAVIFYLTAIAHLDGHFDESEQEYVRDHVSMLVRHRAREAVGTDDLSPYAETIAQWEQHFHEVAGMLAAEVAGYFTESVAEGEDLLTFVTARLKLRCFELFQRFDEAGQAQLLRVADAMIRADGVVHPSEQAFRDELEALLHAPVQLEDDLVEPIEEGALLIEAPKARVPKQSDHPFLKANERAYSRDPLAFAEEAEGDLALIRKVMETLEARRAEGAGMLAGRKDFSAYGPGTSFADGHVHVLMPDDKPVELLVIGDLHGCYSCLKAALMQADFFAKVQAHHDDPARNPAMKLVLLGDYIDRGRFSYNGVLRAAMRLFTAAPGDVYLLRGNHEYYVELNGRVLAPVRPAEAMTSLQGIAQQHVFAAFMKLFEALPTSFVFDRTMFVHAGIPRDETMAEKWVDLSSLNDPDIRFQMLWSDPSTSDFVPAELQAANARFPFGRKQFQRFMGQLGLRAMVRGHEKINEGFRVVYDDPQARLFTLFSSGGKTNDDLPPESSYRDVTPMALTVLYRDGVSEVTPFAIDYARYNDPRVNAFFAEKLAG
jgi:tellurite resistance protein